MTGAVPDYFFTDAIELSTLKPLRKKEAAPGKGPPLAYRIDWGGYSSSVSV